MFKHSSHSIVVGAAFAICASATDVACSSNADDCTVTATCPAPSNEYGGVGDGGAVSDASSALTDGSFSDAPQTNDAPIDRAVTDASDAAVSCPVGQVACSAACVDLQNDGTNCGSCAHDCLGGGCLIGACQAFVVETAANLVADIVPDTDRLYFKTVAVNTAADGAVSALSTLQSSDLTGGSVKTLVNDFKEQGFLMESGSNLFWVNDNEIHRIAKSGLEAPVTLLSGINFSGAARIVDGWIYWLTCASSTFTLSRISVNGGTTSALSTFSAACDPANLFATSNGFYATVGSSPSTIWHIPFSGGAASVAAHGTQTIFSLAESAGELYWTEAAGSGSAVYRFSTGAPVPIALNSSVFISNLIAENGYVYFVVSTRTQLLRILHDGAGTPTVLADLGADFFPGLYEDPISFYWGGPNKTLMRIAK